MYLDWKLLERMKGNEKLNPKVKAKAEAKQKQKQSRAEQKALGERKERMKLFNDVKYKVLCLVSLGASNLSKLWVMP